MFARRLKQISRTIQHAQRFRTIVGIFYKYGYDDIAQKLHLPDLLGLPTRHARAEQEAIRHLPQPERLRRAFEELGPTFVKIGQMLSTRQDVLPEAFNHELVKLQDSAAPLPYEEIEAVLRSELKRPLEEIFQSIDPVPLGSASIAQVHQARLFSGEMVVVKVQRPGIRKVVTEDLEILRYIAGLLETHVEAARIQNPTALVDEITKSLEKEIDFTIEAGHIERFAHQFEGDQTLHIPAVHREFTTMSVLTMEFIDGIKAGLYETSLAPIPEKAEVARRIADSVMRQILVHGFFHADPHPGNIHILPGMTVCFLDFGMMGFLDRRARALFADLLWGIARRDESSVANCLLRLSNAESERPRLGLEADVAELMNLHFYRPLAELDFGRLLGRLLSLTNKHQLRIPPDFSMMLKALGQMESLVRRLDPKHDLIAQAKPFLRDVRLARLSPKHLAEGIMQFGVDFAEMARELPSEIRKIFNKILVGEARVVFKHAGLEPLTQAIERTSNRLAFAVVLAAQIVGSALIMHAKVPPLWHGVSVIGLLGFMVAALMGFWLLISILRHGKM